MRRLFMYVVGAIAALCIVSVGAFAFFRSPHTESANAPSVTPTLDPRVTPLPSVPAYLLNPTFAPPPLTPPPPPTVGADRGGHAITPTLSNTGPTTPAYSEQDVRGYFNAHPMLADGGTAATLATVSFLSARDANARQPSIRLNVADSTLLCIAQFGGQFTSRNGAKPQGGDPPQQIVFASKIVVLDAHSGNMIEEIFSVSPPTP